MASSSSHQNKVLTLKSDTAITPKTSSQSSGQTMHMPFLTSFPSLPTQLQKLQKTDLPCFTALLIQLRTATPNMSLSLRARSVLALSWRRPATPRYTGVQPFVQRDRRRALTTDSDKPAEPFRVLFCGSDVFSVAALEALLGAEGLSLLVFEGVTDGRCMAEHRGDDAAGARSRAWRQGQIYSYVGACTSTGAHLYMQERQD